MRRLAFDATQLRAWDSGLLAFLVGVQDLCKTRGIQMDPGALLEFDLGNVLLVNPYCEGQKLPWQ